MTEPSFVRPLRVAWRGWVQVGVSEEQAVMVALGVAGGPYAVDHPSDAVIAAVTSRTGAAALKGRSQLADGRYEYLFNVAGAVTVDPLEAVLRNLAGHGAEIDGALVCGTYALWLRSTADNRLERVIRLRDPGPRA